MNNDLNIMPDHHHPMICIPIINPYQRIIYSSKINEILINPSIISEQENIVLIPLTQPSAGSWKILTNRIYRSPILNFFIIPIVTVRDTILYGGQILDHCYVLTLEEIVFRQIGHEGENFSLKKFLTIIFSKFPSPPPLWIYL